MEAFHISPVSENGLIVYIDNSLFANIPNIIKKIQEISYDCNFNTQLRLYSNTHIVFYFKVPLNKFMKIENKLEIIEKNTKNILGFLKIQTYNNYLEIYDVCVSKKERGKGIMKTILIDMNKTISQQYQYFWLGVTIDNTRRDAIIQMYLSVGFIYENIQSTNSKGEYIPFVIISMKLYRNIFFKNTLKETNLEIFQGLDSLKCSKDLFLSWDDAFYIHTNSHYEQVEYSGSMNIINGFLKSGPVIKGNVNGVLIPETRLSWHSHPFICYQKTQCYIGWPSGRDMQLIFKNYYLYGLLLHFVFGQEGIYIIRLTEEMMKFMHVISHNTNWIAYISELIEYRFTFLEQYRNIKSDIERLDCLIKTGQTSCLIYESLKQKENIKIFLNRANNFDLRKYLVVGQERKFLRYQKKYPIDNINNNTVEAINYYENFSNTFAYFPVFKVEYVQTYKPWDKPYNIKLNYLQSPNKPYCI